MGKTLRCKDGCVPGKVSLDVYAGSGCECCNEGATLDITWYCKVCGYVIPDMELPYDQYSLATWINERLKNG